MAEPEEKINDTNIQDDGDSKKFDTLAEYRNEDGTFNEDKIKKLAEDKQYFRQQISKLKQLPSNLEEYGKDFVIDSKFNEYMSKDVNKQKIDKIFKKLDDLSLEKGIGIDRNHDIRRFVLDELVENGAIDLTSDAEKAIADQKVIDERNAKVQEVIGSLTDMNAWNQNLEDWLKDFCNSEAEFQMHKGLLERNSIWALSLNKVRHAMMGNKIPVAISEPQYNEEEWSRAFRKADKEEQDRMLQKRAEMLIKNKK